MTNIEEKDDDIDLDTQSFEFEETEKFDDGKKDLNYNEEDNVWEWFNLTEENISIKENDDIYDDLIDWYNDEVKIIMQEKEDLNNNNFEIWEEQQKIIQELSNIWTNLENKEEQDKKVILMWLTMKWMPNIQNVIDERKEYKNIFDILNSKNLNKKALEVLFYSNSLIDYLWKDYLEYFTFEQIYEIFKSITKNEDLFKLILKSKKIKELKTLIKKQYLAKYKFQKDQKTKKKEMQNSLFWFSLNLEIDKSLTEEFENFRETYQKDYNNFETEKLLLLTKKFELDKNQYDDFIELYKFYWENLKEYLLYKEILKQFKKWKVVNKIEEIEWWENFEDTYNELLNWLYQELEEIKWKTVHSLTKDKKLWFKEYNTNIKKYIWVTWFIDDEMYLDIKRKFQNQLPSSWLFRNGVMSKFISWNDKFKKEIFSQVATEQERLDLRLLFNKVDTLNAISELKTQSRTQLKWLKMIEVAQLLTKILKYKQFEWENNYVWECLTKCWFDNIQDYSNTRKLKITLNKILQNQDLSEEEKEQVFIDDVVLLPNWQVQQVSIKYENQVKKILIELYTRIVNEYVTNFKKSEEFNKTYWVTMFWFIEWNQLRKKSKSISYITEKWTYWISLYWIFSSLFSRIEWIWLMNVKINWNWKEQLSWIKFLSLNDDFYQSDYWKRTMIDKKEINCFKNFKAKLIKFIKILWTNPENKNNTIMSIDKNNNYMFMHILKRWEYNEIQEMFISDWETSVVLRPHDMNMILNQINSMYEEKDFISTIRVKEKQHWIVSVKWLNDNWQFQTNDIITNLRFDIKDQFELSMNKWFLWYYLLYYKDYFDKSDYLKYNKWMIIFDLETIWFTWNIILSYFLFVWKYKWRDCVILKRHSNPEYWNFFDNYCSDWIIWDDLKEYIELKLKWDYLLSWHNTIWFDNKRLAVDMYWNDQWRVYQTKAKLDKYSIDTLKLIEEQWFWKIGLDSLSKANFDFWKNITKAWWWLMSVINDLVKIIKENDEATIKKNFFKINRFVLYNKNDVLMSTGILWQMLKYWKIVTEKWICNVDVQWFIKNIRWF